MSQLSLRALSSSRHSNLARATRSFSSASKPFRQFDPKGIIPSGFKQVRIINNTARDAQQSNLSAEMADEHRQVIGTMVDAVYKNMRGEPGYEQIWGGTIPMFDLWKRGVQPFEELRKMTSHMPNTPASALIRSNALTSMGTCPPDVVEEFIRLAVRGGVNVFTTFCAHNDWRNHRHVAEAVRKYGGHYQAALAWAVYHPDPTVYNAQWAVDFFKQVDKLAGGADSLYIKDPSGVLTPEMAGILAAEVKAAFPDKPLVFHTHYQTGYAYMTYLEAIKNGANGVECSLGFADGAGQPYGVTMLRTLEDMGFDTGNPDRKAMEAISNYCKKIRPLYEQGRVVRTPDVNVERTGIAGGQRSILDKELIDANQAHLIPAVDKMVSVVRDEGGKVCQVTPVADSYAREAMRRLRGGNPSSSFAPGYASILTGEGGLVKEPVAESQQRQAIFERASNALRRLTGNGPDLVPSSVSAELAKSEGELLRSICFAVEKYSRPVRLQMRLEEVNARIHQLEVISSKPHLLESLNRQLKRAEFVKADLAGTPFDENKKAQSVADKIKELKAEAKALEVELTETPAQRKEYEELLFGHASDALLHGVLSHSNARVTQLLSEGLLSLPALRRLVASCGLITTCASDLLPGGLAKARKELGEIDVRHNLGLFLNESPESIEELVVVQACFGTAAIPDLALNFFKNFRKNPSFWPPTYDKLAIPPHSTDDAAHHHVASGEQVSSRGLSVAALYLLAKEFNEVQHQVRVSADPASPWFQTSAFRSNLPRVRTFSLTVDTTPHTPNAVPVSETFPVQVTVLDENRFEIVAADQKVVGSARLSFDGRKLVAKLAGKEIIAKVGQNGNKFTVAFDTSKIEFKLPEHSFGRTGVDKGAVAPLAGKITKVLVSPKQSVVKGAALVVMEAMKMEHVIRAGADGVVDKVLFQVGDFAEGGRTLVKFVQTESS